MYMYILLLHTNNKVHTNVIYFQNGPPYFLLFGGLEEKKGHMISIEPITVWQCDVMVRHSDVSHGEYYK